MVKKKPKSCQHSLWTPLLVNDIFVKIGLYIFRLEIIPLQKRQNDNSSAKVYLGNLVTSRLKLQNRYWDTGKYAGCTWNILQFLCENIYPGLGNKRNPTFINLWIIFPGTTALLNVLLLSNFGIFFHGLRIFSSLTFFFNTTFHISFSHIFFST